MNGKPGVLAVMDKDVTAAMVQRERLGYSPSILVQFREARATVERLAAAAEAFVAMYADEPNEEDSFVNPVAFEMRAALAAFRGEQS